MSNGAGNRLSCSSTTKDVTRLMTAELFPNPKIAACTVHVYFLPPWQQRVTLNGAGRQTQQPLFTVIIARYHAPPAPRTPDPAVRRPAAPCTLFTLSASFTCAGGSVLLNLNSAQLHEIARV